MLELVCENAQPGGKFIFPSCFLGVRITNATRTQSLLGRQVIQTAARKVSLVVHHQLPEMVFQRLDDICGLGFVSGMDEVAFRNAASITHSQCQLHLTIDDQVYTISTQTACAWFPPTLEASPRFLLDAAEHLLRQPGKDFGMDFVVIRSQEDAFEVLGRCVDLLSDLGLNQKGSRNNRRQHKRILLKSRCIVHYFLGGSTRMSKVEGQTYDVSQGGFAINAPRELRTGEIVEIEVPKTDGALFVAARVAYCQYISAKNYLIGIRALETGKKPIISVDPMTATQNYSWLSEYLRTRSAWR